MFCGEKQSAEICYSLPYIALIGYGTDRGSEEIALAPLQVVDCPTQLFHDKYQRTQQEYLPVSRAYLIFVDFGAPPHYSGLLEGTKKCVTKEPKKTKMGKNHHQRHQKLQNTPNGFKVS